MNGTCTLCAAGRCTLAGNNIVRLEDVQASVRSDNLLVVRPITNYLPEMNTNNTGAVERDTGRSTVSAQSLNDWLVVNPKKCIQR